MRGQKNKRPTLRTIADITGLAVPTVSRALSDAPDIGCDTKSRVRAIASQIGYVPNRAGLRLRTGKTHAISVVLEAEVEIMDHAGQYVASIAAALSNTSYHLSVTPYLNQGDLIGPVRHIVENGTADAVILNKIESEDPRVSYLMRQNFPFVTFGRSRWRDQHPYFDFDNADFARAAVQLFARRDRRCAALLAPPRRQNYAQDLIAGAQAEAIRSGLKFSLIEGADIDGTTANMQSAVAQYLTTTPGIDALICPSAGSALAAAVAAEACGRKIGDDLDIYAKETSRFLTGIYPGMFAVQEDVALAGRILADAVLQAIESPDLPPVQKTVLPQLVDDIKV